MKRVILTMSCVVLSAACTNLETFERGVCGNRLYEPERGEDCDAEKHGDFDCVQCRIACGEGDACPDGYVCGGDKICRQPQQMFAPHVRAPEIAGELSDLLVVDIDADGIDDVALLANEDDDSKTNRLFMHHFGPVAAESYAHPALLKGGVPLVAGQLGESDTMSLLVAPNPRLASVMPLRSRAEARGLLPALASQYAGLSSTATLGPSVHGDSIVPVFDEHILVGLIDAVLPPTPPTILESPLLLATDTEVESFQSSLNVVVGRFLDSFELDQMVVAEAGADEVKVYDAVSDAIWPYTSVDLPQSASVLQGAWVGDVNGDGHADILVGATGGSTLVSYGTGAFTLANLLFSGGFSSSPTVDVFDDAFSPDPVIEGARPLAVGELDGDGYADYVFGAPFGVALSGVSFDSGAYLHCPEPLKRRASHGCGLHGGGDFDADAEFDTLPRWSVATLADLNGDDRNDVIAAVEGRSDVDLLYTTSPETLSRHRIGTPHPVRAIVSGDFDTDGVGDVALHTEDESGATVSVIYGQTSGYPEAVVVFEAGHIGSLQTAPTGRHLFILSSSVEGEKLSLSIAGGSTERELVAPLEIPCPVPGGQTPEAVTQQVVTGRFVAEDRVDTALLYRDCFIPVGAPERDQLVLLPTRGKARIQAPFEDPLDFDCLFDVTGCTQAFEAFHPTSATIQQTASFVEAGVDWSHEAVVVTVDLTGDDKDELVLLGPDTRGGAQMIIARVVDADGPNPRFELDRAEPLTVPIGGEYGKARSHAHVADVDGDEHLDLVLSIRPEEGANTSGLLVLFGDGHGFDGELRLTLPSGGPIDDFALLDHDYDGDVTAAWVLSEEEARLVELPHPSSLADTAVGSLDAIVTLEVGGADRIAVGDFDGDGLLEPIATGPNVVYAFRSKPVIE